ncbi:SufE family protein [Prochlorococcus marinus]|uniref:SufE family protein n=1 Tax=Prochlorococcus marinus TaxID=1219 RepID=UPI0022B531B5|nr:SufE family protein [Prochlorococcus marinus]
MAEEPNESRSQDYGSDEINKVVLRMKSCTEPRKRYEYLLSLAKNFTCIPVDSLCESMKVKGCISQVYVFGELIEGKLLWKGYSDALITKGMLALLIKGLNNLTPKEVMEINPSFIPETGLNKSLTPSRANGFMNIFLKMRTQAATFCK